METQRSERRTITTLFDSNSGDISLSLFIDMRIVLICYLICILYGCKEVQPTSSYVPPPPMKPLSGIVLQGVIERGEYTVDATMENLLKKVGDCAHIRLNEDGTVGEIHPCACNEYVKEINVFNEKTQRYEKVHYLLVVRIQ